MAKIEGTSQTYGQFISFRDSKDVASSTGKTTKLASSVSPKDVIVKVIDVENVPGDFSFDDIDRSKIAIAAVSEAKEPTVVLTKDKTDENSTLNNSSQNNFSNVSENQPNYAIVLGSSTKSKADIKRIVLESSKVDMFICLKSKFSEDLDFNNLKEIDLQSNFVYNFYESGEGDIQEQEDQSKDPLLKNNIFNVPRYVELKWTPVSVTSPLSLEETLSTDEVKSLKREVFMKSRGVSANNTSNMKHSFENSKKKLNLYEQEGRKIEVPDIHSPDVGMQSVSNKRAFGNAVNTVISPKKNTNTTYAPVVKNPPPSSRGRGGGNRK